VVSEIAAKYLATRVRKAPVTAAAKSRRKPRKPRKRATLRPRAQPDAPLTQSPIGDKLTDEVKLFVVQQLAFYDPPQKVADLVKEHFGIEVTRQAIHYYDPTHDPQPPEKWCQIFAETRKAFLEKTADLAAANKSVRVYRLQRMAEAAEKMKNLPLAQSMYRQIAEEIGEVYTNRSKLAITDPNGEAFRVIVEEDSRGPTGGQG
jgi:hypothetical protein